MNRDGTVSKVSLLTICAFPFRDDVVVPREPTSSSAKRGTDVHAAIEATINGQPVPELGKVARRYYDAWLAGWWRERKDQFWFSEIAYSINPHTRVGKRLELTGPREYPHEDGCIEGTIDALRFGGRTAEVDDFKTGDDPPAVYRNGQLYTLGLAVARAHDLDSVRVAITHIQSSQVSRRTRLLDRDELEAWSETLARALERVPNAEPAPGPHCESLYCGLRRNCPGRPRLKIDTFDEFFVTETEKTA